MHLTSGHFTCALLDLLWPTKWLQDNPSLSLCRPAVTMVATQSHTSIHCLEAQHLSCLVYCSFVGGNDAQLAAHVPEGTSAKAYCSALLGNNNLHNGSDSDSSEDNPYHRYGLPHSYDSSDDEVVVPRAPAQQRLVAYIMSKPKNPDKTENVFVYTNSSALPLLLPIKSKWTKGKPCHHLRTSAKPFASLMHCQAWNVWDAPA